MCQGYRWFADSSLSQSVPSQPQPQPQLSDILYCVRGTHYLPMIFYIYSGIKKLFSFLTEYDSMKYDDLKAQLELVVSTYSSDLEASVLDVFLQFKDILSSESDRSVTNISTLLNSKDGILTTAFPNISILVRIFLTIPVTNCEGERWLFLLYLG